MLCVCAFVCPERTHFSLQNTSTKVYAAESLSATNLAPKEKKQVTQAIEEANKPTQACRQRKRFHMLNKATFLPLSQKSTPGTSCSQALVVYLGIYSLFFSMLGTCVVFNSPISERLNSSDNFCSAILPNWTP
jgi:hypothetical protein